MEDIKSRMKELCAERELEEALDNESLSPKERAAIEEQLCMIRRKYQEMVAELYA